MNPVAEKQAPYSADAAQEEELDDAAALVKQTLILIDFNGMLVLKDKHREIENNPAALRFFVGGTGRGCCKFYLRPGVEQLIASLANDTRCKFAIYTSMMRHNIMPFVEMFDDAQAPFFDPIPCGASSVCTSASLAQSIWKLFDQRFNSKDPQPGDPYGFKRNLQAIWRDRSVAAAGFASHNTLLVEGEAIKCRDWLANTMSPAEFDVAEATAHNGGSEALTRLREDLDHILTAMQQPGATIPAVLAHMRTAQRPLPPAESTPQAVTAAAPSSVPATSPTRASPSMDLHASQHLSVRPPAAETRPPLTTESSPSAVTAATPATLSRTPPTAALPPNVLSIVKSLISQGDKSCKKLQYLEAVEHYTAAIALDANDVKAYSRRSSAYANLQKFEDALKDAERCAHLEPASSCWHLHIGRALTELGRYADAVARFRRAGKHCNAKLLIRVSEGLQHCLDEQWKQRCELDEDEHRCWLTLTRVAPLRYIATLLSGNRQVSAELWLLAGFSQALRQKDLERLITEVQSNLHRDPEASPSTASTPRECSEWTPPEEEQLNSAPTKTITIEEALERARVEVRLIRNKTWVSTSSPQVRGIVQRAFDHVVKGSTIELSGDQVMSLVDVVSRTISLTAIDIVNNNNAKLVMSASSLFYRSEEDVLMVKEEVELSGSESHDDEATGCASLPRRRRKKQKSKRRVKMLGFYVFRAKKT